MNERNRQILAISREVTRLLAHPAWREFEQNLGKSAIEFFLDNRDRDLDRNPFLRQLGQFNAVEETHAFLLTVLQSLSFDAEYGFSQKTIHAARELANILGVPVPPPDGPESRISNRGQTSDRHSGGTPTFFQPQKASVPFQEPLQPSSNQKRLEALKNLMTHPTTSEHERRAALEAYMRLLDSEKEGDS